VARVCLDALENPAAVGRIIEITSRAEQAGPSLGDWLAAQPAAT
jgi:hypothetical protein